MPITVSVSTHCHSVRLWAPAHLDAAAELHREGKFRVRDLPRIAELEPLVRLLHLVAVHDPLVEDAEIVAQAVADGGNLSVDMESRKQAASRPKPPLPRPASTSWFAQLVPIQAELRHAPRGRCPPSAG